MVVMEEVVITTAEMNGEGGKEARAEALLVGMRKQMGSGMNVRGLQKRVQVQERVEGRRV
jgi:hypothetical protein